jgi:hypothetical protein
MVYIANSIFQGIMMLLRFLIRIAPTVMSAADKICLDPVGFPALTDMHLIMDAFTKFALPRLVMESFAAV